MQPSEIALIFDHLYWVRDRILDTASAPGVTWPGTAPAGLLDLRATLVHELDVEWSWRQAPGEHRTRRRSRPRTWSSVPDDFPSGRLDPRALDRRRDGAPRVAREPLGRGARRSVRRGGVAEPPAVVAPPAPLHPCDPAAQQRRVAAQRRRPLAGRARLPRVPRQARDGGRSSPSPATTALNHPTARRRGRAGRARAARDGALGRAAAACRHRLDDATRRSWRGAADGPPGDAEGFATCRVPALGRRAGRASSSTRTAASRPAPLVAAASAASSTTRALTMRVMSAVGIGWSAGNWIVALPER